MPNVRKLTFSTRFALRDRTLRTANRRVDRFKNRVQQSGTLLDRMRNKAAMAGKAITTAFKDARRSLGRGVAVLQRYRHQLALGAGAMTVGIGKMVKDAGDANEAVNKFQVVFGEVADQTRKWANQYSDAIGRSEYATIEWLNSFQDVLVPMGLARDEAASLSKRMVKLAADLGSFNNVATDKAARAMQSALVGNHEAVRNLGIQLSETQLDMVAQREGYKKSFRELDNLTKMQLRFQEMIRQSGDAVDDATRTAMEFNNQWLRFQGNMRDVSVSMGRVFIPIFRNALLQVNNFLGALQKSEKLQIAARFFGIATAIMAIGAAIGFVSAAWPVLAGLFSWPFFAVAAGIVGIAIAIEDIWVSLQGGEGKIIPFINQFLDWIGVSWEFVDVVHGIGTALQWLWTGTKATVKLFLPLFKSVFKGINDILFGTTKMIVGAFQMITGLIRGLLTGDFQQFENGLWNFYEGFGQAFGGIINIVSSAVKFIYDVIAGVFNWFKGMEWEWPTLDIGAWWNNVKDGWNQVDVKGMMKSVWDEMLDAMPGWMQNWVNSITSRIPDIKKTIKGKFQEAIDFVKENPLKVVQWIIPGFRLIPIFNKAYKKARDWLAENAGIKLPDIKLPTLPDVVGAIRKWVNNFKNEIKEINMAQAFKEMIDETINKLPGWMQGMAKKMMNFLPQSPAKEGPMKKLDKVGPGLTDTIAQGINKNQDRVDRSLIDLWSGAPTKPNQTTNKTVKNSTVNNRSTQKSESKVSVSIDRLFVGGSESDDAAMKAKFERMAREVFGQVMEEEYSSVAGEA